MYTQIRLCPDLVAVDDSMETLCRQLTAGCSLRVPQGCSPPPCAPPRPGPWRARSASPASSAAPTCAARRPRAPTTRAVATAKDFRCPLLKQLPRRAGLAVHVSGRPVRLQPGRASCARGHRGPHCRAKIRPSAGRRRLVSARLLNVARATLQRPIATYECEGPATDSTSATKDEMMDVRLRPAPPL